LYITNEGERAMQIRVSDKDIATMVDSYKSYLAGTYIKTPYLYLSQFQRLYNELDNTFTGFGNTGKVQFIKEANTLLKGYFELFSNDKDVCLEIAEQVTDLIDGVINSDSKDMFLGWWATAQLSKLISQFFLKIKVSYEKMIADCEEMQTGDIIDEYENEIEMMYDRLKFKALADNQEKYAEQERQFKELFLKEID
jgi:hypothetical protein